MGFSAGVLKEGVQLGGVGQGRWRDVYGPERGVEGPFAPTCHGGERKGGRDGL